MSQTEPLRILHLTGASDAGGLSRYLLDLCAGLAARGHEVTIAGQRGAWHDRFVKAGWRWIDLPLRGGPVNLWRAARQVRSFLDEHPADVIHTHYRKPTMVARRAVGRGGERRVPILYTVHQPRIRLAGPWKWLSDFGDHTHVPSRDARQWLMEEAAVAEERITVIPHGVNVARFPLRDGPVKSAARKSLGLMETATIAAFVGRLDVPKNAAWMLDVAEACRGKVAKLKVVIAGDGPEMAEMRRGVESRRLGDCVTMLGECEVLPVYQAADALLSPSQREGFSLVCAEAMCVGVPVLRTRTGGAEEMIVENVTGASTPVDCAAFAAAAERFLSDRAALEKMGSAAAERIRQEFTLDRQIDKTIELYHSMQGRG